MGRLKRFLKKKEKKQQKAERNALGMKIHNWDFHLKIWTPVEYELKIIFNAEDKLFLTIFQKAKERLEKKDVDYKGDPALIDRFDLDERFFNLIKTYLKKPFNITAEDILRDNGFMLLDYHVVNGWFERDENKDWLIHLVLKGTYTDKR